MSTHPSMNAANLVGQASLANAAAGLGMFGPLTTSSPYEQKTRQPNKVVFSAKIEVVKAANGYLVHIGRTEGYEYETHIARDVSEVNQIITAQMVAFRLEDGN